MSRRDRQPELMDDPDLEPDRHRRALAGLARLNRISGSGRLVWSALRDLVVQGGAAPLRVLDIATGGGDVPLALVRCARRAGVKIEVDGGDVSPTALAAARAAAERSASGRGGAVPVRFFPLDALRETLPRGYDAVVCSLFLHHLSEESAVQLLAAMAAAARRRVVVNELRRSPVNAALVTAAARLVTRSRIVHVDGLRSVRAAFSPRELRALARRAGLGGAVVKSRFPCRMLLTWDRP